jgi:GT2 family glycosyltransferase
MKPVVNICMIAKDRPRLTEQALRSLTLHTPKELYNLTFVDDGSSNAFYYRTFNHYNVLLPQSKGIVGFARNFAIRAAEQYWGRGDFLCCLDNDIYALPNWLHRMTTAMNEHPAFAIVGGCRHPYHGVNSSHGPLVATDAVAGYSMMMRWEHWDAFGAFDAHAVGLGQSEDYAVCRRAVDAGLMVGYMNPSVLLHTGITNTEGKLATGAENFERLPGVIFE